MNEYSSDTKKVAAKLAGITDACANVHDDERLSELFALAPVEATYVSGDGEYFSIDADGDWISAGENGGGVCVSPYAPVLIPPRERELNRLAQDFGSWAEVQDYAELSESRTVKVNGEWFRFQEWKERRDNRIAAGLIDVSNADEPYAAWADVPDDLQEIVIEYPEWLNQHYDFVFKCEDGGDEFVMHCFEGDPRDKFSREQHKRARELYLQEHAQQDSQQEWEGLEVGSKVAIKKDLESNSRIADFAGREVTICSVFMVDRMVAFSFWHPTLGLGSATKTAIEPIQPEQKPDDLSLPDKTGIYRVRYHSESAKCIMPVLIFFCTCHGWANKVIDPTGGAGRNSDYALKNMISFQIIDMESEPVDRLTQGGGDE